MNLNSVFTLISFTSTLFLAFFVFYQGHRHLANKVFTLAMLSVSVMEFSNFMLLNSPYPQRLLFWARFSLIGCCLISANWSLFSIIFARTHYERISRRFKLILLAVYIFSVSFLFFIPSDKFITIPHTGLPMPDIIILGAIGRMFCIFLLLAFVFILFNLETIYRNSTGIKKWQIKYSIIGIFAAFTYYIYIVSKAVLFSFINLTFIPIGSVVIIICTGILAFSLIRHRLMNIDIFISRQVFHGSFTLIVISCYLILVGFLGQLIRMLSIDFKMIFYPIFVLLSLVILTILGLSKRNRKIVLKFIDRHFFRNKYDYRSQWIKLTSIISFANDLNDLLKKISELIAEIMCVNEIIVWLHDNDDQRFHLITSMFKAESEELINSNSPLIKYIADKAEPFSVISEEKGAKDAKFYNFYNLNKEFFKRYNVSVICPLIVKDELIGFITLGREITNAVYSYEDYDMLKTICHQAANAIMKIKLSERLVAAGEMEVMNKISSFVLHDLKNSISMLSLIIQNASKNMNNPEFQQDILETISKTIENMKTLIARISNLPRQIELNKTKTNVNNLLRDTIEKTRVRNNGIELIEDYADLPDINLDQEKIQSVIRNLIINAMESLKANGKVLISTLKEDEYIVIEVKDNGPGMSQEFIKYKLFKPFQTTKKKGLGIGLYQCKIIITAHGGKIEAKSEEGRGAQFRIFLPRER